MKGEMLEDGETVLGKFEKEEVREKVVEKGGKRTGGREKSRRERWKRG